MELAEVALKNNIFKFHENFLELLCGTTIGTMFAPP